MPSAPRNFDEEFGYEGKEGISFVLGGHEFHTKSVAPPAAFLHGEEGGLTVAVTFLRRCLVPEDRDVFDKMVDDPDVLISGFQIDSVAAWLVEEISGRPTEQPASSGGGGKKRSTGSKVASLSRAKTGSE